MLTADNSSEELATLLVLLLIWCIALVSWEVMLRMINMTKIMPTTATKSIRIKLMLVARLASASVWVVYLMLFSWIRRDAICKSLTASRSMPRTARSPTTGSNLAVLNASSAWR